MKKTQQNNEWSILNGFNKCYVNPSKFKYGLLSDNVFVLCFCNFET